MEGQRPTAPPRMGTSLTVLLAAGVLVSVVAVVPGVRSTPGFEPILDGWLKATTYLLIALLVALRPILRRSDRTAWS